MTHTYIKFSIWGIIAISLILAFTRSVNAFSPHDDSIDLPLTTKVIAPISIDSIEISKTFDAFQDIGKQSGQSSIESAVRTYLENNPQVLGGLTLNDLRFKETRQYKLPHKNMSCVEYVQQKNGFDVEFSLVIVSASRLPKGETLIYVNAKVFPQINELLDPAQPMLTEQIVDASAQSIGLDTDKAPVYHEKRIISLGENNTLQLKTLLTFEEDPHWTVVVGQGGVEGVRSNVMHAAPPGMRPPTVSGTVQGRGYRFFTSPQQPLDVLPMPHLDVTLSTIASITDRMGVFSFINQPAGSLRGRLRGPYVDVINAQGSNLSFNTFVPQNTPTAITVNPAGNSEFDIAQVNAFHHINIAHDWVKSRTGFTGIDLMLPVRVNDTIGTCNAGYLDVPSPSIFFYAASLSESCNNFAYDTIVHHEYGHFVDDRAGVIPFSLEGLAVSEGWGDIFASYISGQPLFAQADILMRNADNTILYPSNGLDLTYNLGKSLSGFAWDLRRNLITRYGNPLRAEQLILASLLANSSSVPNAVLNLVLADDDDNNLNNGTPHLGEITAAASKHHLYPFIAHAHAVLDTPVRDQLLLTANAPQLTISGSARHNAFVSYQLSYGVGKNPSAWIPIGSAVTTPVIRGILGTWTLPTTPGTYMLKLVVNTATPLLQYQYLTPVQVNTPFIPFALHSDTEEVPFSDGRSVVWRRFDQTTFSNDIYRWNSGAASLVATGVAGDVRPKISGSLLLWGNIVKDLFNNQQRTLPVNSAEISGNTIVWAAFDATINATNIFIHDHAANQTSSIAGFVGDRRDPFISGNSVVYEVIDRQTGDSEIYHYDLITQVERRVTNDPFKQLNPAVDGNIVVYEDMRNGNPEIYAYDLSTATEARISQSPLKSRNPSVKGNIIVWSEADMEGRYEWALTEADIFYYDLTARQTVALTVPFESLNLNPAVENIPGSPLKLIVWQSTLGNAGWNIVGAVVQ